MERKTKRGEVISVAEKEATPVADLARQIREGVTQELQAQAGRLEQLERSLGELREQQKQFEAALGQQLDALEALEVSAGPAPGLEAPLEKLLGSVRNLIVATLPEQVFDVLCEEAEQMGVRAAVFDVRGKAAWGSSARGFGSRLPEKTFHRLAVSLTQENPFRQVYETGGHVQGGMALLKKNRNVLEALKPAAEDMLLLLPIRSAGSVSAIFYVASGDGKAPLPADALRILGEFAGAQLDRLMALSGGLPSEAVSAQAVEEEAAPAEPVEPEVTVEAEPAVSAPTLEVPPEPEPAAPVPEFEAVGPLPEVEVVPAAESPAPGWFPETPASAPAPEVEQPVEIPVVAEAPPPASAPPPEEPAAAPAVEAAPPPPEVPQLSEADQKIHRDARRFARLLVSEIELYNKAKVTDGRKNKDIYRRLKSDIDRSRQTYEKRFGKALPKQFDYFHEELVRSLASNDPSLLGSDYSGPKA
jgi:chaperonin cofactor prefoldin